MVHGNQVREYRSLVPLERELRQVGESESRLVVQAVSAQLQKSGFGWIKGYVELVAEVGVGMGRYYVEFE